MTQNFHPGIFWGDDEVWEEQRKFALATLKEEGMGKETLEPMILEEVQAYLNELRKVEGTPYDIAELIHMASSNVIQSVLLGYRSEYDDECFRHQVGALLDRIKACIQTTATDNIPLIKWLPGDITAKAMLIRASQDIYDHTAQCVTDHKMDLDPSNAKGYLEHYLVKMKADVGKPTSFNGKRIIFTACIYPYHP